MTTEYNAWKKMRQRCLNPNDPKYDRYGGRGITICDRWEYYENFIEDMGKKTSPIHTLNRLDNDGNYEPGNCVWSTPTEQANNRDDSYYILNMNEAEQIRDLYRNGIYTQHKISIIYNMSQQHISRIVRNANWKRTQMVDLFA
jgi:hypothetical protein